MEKNGLYIVGTVHFDLDGPNRLYTLLERLSPSVIALEFNKDRENSTLSDDVRQKQKRSMEEAVSGLGLNSTQKVTLLESGRIISEAMTFELNSSRRYVEKNKKTRLEYIDLSVFANGEKEFIDGYLESFKLEMKKIASDSDSSKMVGEKLDAGLDSYLNGIRENVQQIYEMAGVLGEIFDEVREPETLELIKSSMPNESFKAIEQMFNPERDNFMGDRIRDLYNGKNRLVAVVGLGHLSRIKRRIDDLKPRIMTLAEYDSV